MTDIGRYSLAWLLSLCMIIMPLSSIAHARATPPAHNTSGMPCHQMAADSIEQVCPLSGQPGCNCCEFAVPTGLTPVSLSPEMILYIALVRQDIAPDSYLSQPQSPPYRPPRRHA